MDAESLFLEFRATRAPDALGAVFDLVADGLFSVALHLSPDRNEAEDLVQATFLIAIERAERWDASRPLRPWLLGILHREAKTRRRRARRTPEPERLARRAEEPVQSALAAEAMAVVTGAITRVPQPYRDVLDLHLVQALPHGEIAARLARSPGAVRTQLWRGLELLRALLPAGLALTVAAQVGAEAGLAALRQRVLDAASAKVGVAAAGVAAGALVMKKIAIGVAAAVVVAAGWLVWQMPRANLAVHDTAVPAPALVASDPPPAHETPARDESAQPAESTRAAIGMAPAETAAALITVRGRCVDADTRAPLVGCDLRLQGSPRIQGQGTDVFAEPKRAKTDALGAFVLSFAPRADYYFRLTFASAEHLDRSAEWSRTEPGEVDLGDVPMEIGCAVRGTIADTHGVAQGGLHVHVGRDDGAYGAEGLLPTQADSTMSKAGGSFSVRAPFGKWRLHVQQRQLVSSDLVTIERGQRALELSVTIKALDEIESISGVLVDETGAPVGGVVVRPTELSGRFDVNQTARDGTFRVDRPKNSSGEPVRLEFESSRNTLEAFETDEKYPWGTTDLRLVMQRKLTVELEVVDAETGTAIEDYGVRCFATPKPPATYRMTSGDFDTRFQGKHPGGKVRIDRVARGSNTLVVLPADRTWDATKTIEFDGAGLGERTLRVELPRNAGVLVRVGTRDGAPCAGSEVELLKSCTEQPIELGTIGFRPGRVPFTFPIIALFVDSGTTDAQGVVTLHGPPGVALGIRALGPGHVPCVREVTLVPDAEIEIAVDRGATLAGTFGPTRLLDKLREQAGANRSRQPGLRLYRSDGTSGAFPTDAWTRFPIGADGAFRWSGIPAGTWDAHFEFDVAQPGELGHHGQVESRSELLATLDLHDGETRSVQWSLDALFPGRISGRVLLDGSAPGEARVWLEGRTPDGRAGERPILTRAPLDAAGAFSVEAFPATYVLHLRFQRDGAEHELPARETVTVMPDATVEQTFTVQSTSARVRLLSRGAPLAGVMLSAATPDNTWQEVLAPTDADGWTTIDPAPAVRLEVTTCRKGLEDPRAWLEYWSANRANSGAWQQVPVVVGQIELHAGEPSEVELVMPESAGY